MTQGRTYDHLDDDELTIAIINTLEGKGITDHGLERPEGFADSHRLAERREPTALAVLAAHTKGALTRAQRDIQERHLRATLQAKILQRTIGATVVFSTVAYALGLLGNAGVWGVVVIWSYFFIPQNWSKS
jgi:hypothetical protein